MKGKDNKLQGMKKSGSALALDMWHFLRNKLGVQLPDEFRDAVKEGGLRMTWNPYLNRGMCVRHTAIAFFICLLILQLYAAHGCAIVVVPINA